MMYKFILLGLGLIQEIKMQSKQSVVASLIYLQSEQMLLTSIVSLLASSCERNFFAIIDCHIPRRARI